MKLPFLASLSLFAAAAFPATACGGAAYVGDLPLGAEESDGGTGSTPDSGVLDSSSPDSPPDGPALDGGATDCVRWGGSCKADRSACAASEYATSLGEDGCSTTNVCCAPKCYPTNPGCPPGMTPSPLADALCAPGIACIPIPTTECATKGGSCMVDDGTALPDPCTALGRPIGPFGCGDPKLLCCSK